MNITFTTSPLSSQPQVHDKADLDAILVKLLQDCSNMLAQSNQLNTTLREFEKSSKKTIFAMDDEDQDHNASAGMNKRQIKTSQKLKEIQLKTSMMESQGSKILIESYKTIASVATCASSTPQIIDDEDNLTCPKAPKLSAMPDPVGPAYYRPMNGGFKLSSSFLNMYQIQLPPSSV